MQTYSLEDYAKIFLFNSSQSFDQSKNGRFQLDDFISLCIFLQSTRYVHTWHKIVGGRVHFSYWGPIFSDLVFCLILLFIIIL